MRWGRCRHCHYNFFYKHLLLMEIKRVEKLKSNFKILFWDYIIFKETTARTPSWKITSWKIKISFPFLFNWNKKCSLCLQQTLNKNLSTWYFRNINIQAVKKSFFLKEDKIVIFLTLIGLLRRRTIESTQLKLIAWSWREEILDGIFFISQLVGGHFIRRTFNVETHTHPRKRQNKFKKSPPKI